MIKNYKQFEQTNIIALPEHIDSKFDLSKKNKYTLKELYELENKNIIELGNKINFLTNGEFYIKIKHIPSGFYLIEDDDPSYIFGSEKGKNISEKLSKYILDYDNMDLTMKVDSIVIYRTDSLNILSVEDDFEIEFVISDETNSINQVNDLKKYDVKTYEKGSFLYWLKQKYSDENQWENLIIIDCSYQKLENLDGIENLINLKVLICYNNNLTSLNEIKNLINLEKLDCWNNNLTDLKGIENLITLKYLYCSKNNLTNLNGIENLINLKELCCNNNDFSNDYKDYLRNYCKEKNIYLEI